jgi:hypothetical protein
MTFLPLSGESGDQIMGLHTIFNLLASLNRPVPPLQAIDIILMD